MPNRTPEEREALLERMRVAAERGDSMLEFGKAEGITLGAVSGLRHRHGIQFHGDDDVAKRRARASERMRRTWAPGGRRFERRHAEQKKGDAS